MPCWRAEPPIPRATSSPRSTGALREDRGANREPGARTMEPGASRVDGCAPVASDLRHAAVAARPSAAARHSDGNHGSRGWQAMRHLKLALRAGLVLIPLLCSATHAGAQGPAVLLELYTSQGCSSCPPADALLPTFIARRDVVALSLPVDYWDRLGWKDTFARPEFTRRQYEYAQGRGDRQVYTPQIVVGGRTHVVGSSRREIEEAIAIAQNALRSNPVALQTELSEKDLVIAVGPATGSVKPDRARVILALVQREGRVAIKRGENANREVVYHNIVKSLRVVGDWEGTARTWRVPISELGGPNVQSLVVMVQLAPGGPIAAVTQLEWKG
ncbi:MAG: DUF1223 domain-containing protein [Hyphomicrobiaceae bacterium]|nr:DUF1223 domain-containing protein [Hyphomicrobiaceae bacterium]